MSSATNNHWLFSRPSKLALAIFSMVFLPGLFAMPPPQLVMDGSGIAYNIDKQGVVTYQSADMKMAADWLVKKLNDENGNQWSVTTTRTRDADSGNIEIHAMPEDNRIPFNKTDKRYQESYIIQVDNNIKLYVGGAAGALYGVQRLLEKIRNRSLIKEEIIVDYPDYKWRGVYIYPARTRCGSVYMLKSPADRKKWSVCMESLIDYWRSLRINALFLQSFIYYRLNDNDIEVLDRLFHYARLNNIEPVPVLGSKLSTLPADRLKKDAIEGVYHQNVEFKAESDRLIPARKVTVNAAADIQSVNKEVFLSRVHRKFAFNKKENGKQISIVQSAASKPWKNPVFLRNAKGSIRLKVIPGQYHELMLSIRSNKNQVARVGVAIIEEFDDRGNRLSEPYRYTHKVFASHDWRKRWFPLFVSPGAHEIKLRIVVENRGSEEVRVEISDPMLLPMKDQLINVLVNDETSPIVWSRDRKTKYVSGKDYEISHAEIKEWRDVGYKNIKKTEIKILPGSRIQNGQYLRVDFDTLPFEYRSIPASKYSIGSTYTYREYKKIFRKIKSLSPKFVHVSMDEHTGGMNRDSRSLRMGLCNRDLYINYINTLDSLLRKKKNISLPQGGSIQGAGLDKARLIIWDDMLNPWHNGGKASYQIPFGGVYGGTSLTADPDCNKNTRLQQSVLLASWWYRDNDERGVVKNTPAFYKEQQYQYFISTWYQQKGIVNWVKSADPAESEGFIATTWDKKYHEVPSTACAAWNRSEYKKCLSQTTY